MWAGIDKRRFPRAHFQCQVVVRRKDHPESFSTRTENIGAGGICVILNKGLELFSEVVAELFLPDDASPLINDGRIVWVVKEATSLKHFDTGIEFIDLPPDQRERVEGIVQKILQGEYKTAGAPKR